MRFYVLNQSQIMIAVAVAIISAMAVAWLIVFAWRVLGEAVERTDLDDSELICRYCKSKAIHPSFRSGILDHIFWLFSCVPYRCYVCSWRFYVRRPGAPSHTA
jgi:hypothetical protein